MTAIVVAFAAYGVLLFWYLADHSPDLMGPVLTGAWVIQAHLFAIWAAFGPGKFLLRLPPVVAIFLTVLGAPAVRPDGQFERGEFLAMALIGTSIFAVTTILLVVVRRFVGWRIENPEASPHSGTSQYGFSIWYLIALTTLLAAALGIYTNIVYEQPEPVPFNIFGPGFVIAIIVYGGATIAVLLWPVIAVPLCVLSTRRSKRSVVVAVTLWAVITSGVITFWHFIDDNPGSDALEMLLGAILLQSGAAVMGTFAALPLRWLGLRLVGRNVHDIR